MSNVILIILSVSMLMAVYGKVIYNKYNCNKNNKTLVAVMTVLSLIFFVFAFSFTIIPTGSTGVRMTFGQISNMTVQNGFNWKIPFVQKIETVNNKQQDIIFKDRIWSETSERTAIYYNNVVVTYQINAEKSSWIYANVTNYEENLVTQSLVASAVKSSSKSLGDTDATNRSIIEPKVSKSIQEALNQKYGENTIIVNKVVIDNADFDESYNKTIAAKQKAQIEAEKQAIDNKKAVDKAKANAEVKKINAKATAEANELMEKSISENILKQMYINKWDSVLPQYVSGDESSIMLGINTQTEKETNKK